MVHLHTCFQFHITSFLLTDIFFHSYCHCVRISRQISFLWMLTSSTKTRKEFKTQILMEIMSLYKSRTHTQTDRQRDLGWTREFRTWRQRLMQFDVDCFIIHGHLKVNMLVLLVTIQLPEHTKYWIALWNLWDCFHPDVLVLFCLSALKQFEENPTGIQRYVLETICWIVVGWISQ